MKDALGAIDLRGSFGPTSWRDQQFPRQASLSGTEPRLIVAKFQFSMSSVASEADRVDVLQIQEVLFNRGFAEVDFDRNHAGVSKSFDESRIDTISIHLDQYQVSELRIGTTFDDAVSRVARTVAPPVVSSTTRPTATTRTATTPSVVPSTLAATTTSLFVAAPTFAPTSMTSASGVGEHRLTTNAVEFTPVVETFPPQSSLPTSALLLASTNSTIAIELGSSAAAASATPPIGLVVGVSILLSFVVLLVTIVVVILYKRTRQRVLSTITDLVTPSANDFLPPPSTQVCVDSELQPAYQSIPAVAQYHIGDLRQ
jgi:hypothetical protein